MKTEQEIEEQIRDKQQIVDYDVSLAHGNETFVQVGGNFTIEDLFKMNKEITNFLKELLDETEDYIRNKKYLNAVA